MTEHAVATLESTCNTVLRLGASAVRFIPLGRDFLEAGRTIDELLTEAAKVPADPEAVRKKALAALAAMEHLSIRLGDMRYAEAYQALLAVTHG